MIGCCNFGKSISYIKIYNYVISQFGLDLLSTAYSIHKRAILSESIWDFRVTCNCLSVSSASLYKHYVNAIILSIK